MLRATSSNLFGKTMRMIGGGVSAAKTPQTSRAFKSSLRMLIKVGQRFIAVSGGRPTTTHRGEFEPLGKRFAQKIAAPILQDAPHQGKTHTANRAGSPEWGSGGRGLTSKTGAPKTGLTDPCATCHLPTSLLLRELRSGRRFIACRRGKRQERMGSKWKNFEI